MFFMRQYERVKNVNMNLEIKLMQRFYSLFNYDIINIFMQQGMSITALVYRKKMLEFSVSFHKYLSKGARSRRDLPDHSQRDADHRGHGHEPADTIAPVRIGVHVVVLQRFVLNQEEQENALHKTKKTFNVYLYTVSLKKYEV